MDGFQPHFTVRMCLSFLLLILLQTSTEAQICEDPLPVEFKENNKVGDVVTTFTVQTGATVAFTTPEDPNLPFEIKGNSLIATAVLDYETRDSYTIKITCTAPSFSPENHNVIILVEDVNDKPPLFEHDLYNVTVNEMTPVDTSVGSYPASDSDTNELYYTLKPESSGFKLLSQTNPTLLIETPLEYDKVKSVTLTLEVQDTPFDPPSGTVSFNASTTIVVTIKDVDNRQPWFQPCTKYDIDGVVSCESTGYTGWVVLSEQAPGVLELKPGQLHAIDGDSGINEEITYSILSGNKTKLFAINETTGGISMLKPADVLGDIILTVRASQKINIYQFATTTVKIKVQEKSLHRPKFQKSLYQGVVAAAGNMVMDLNNKVEPLRIIATDEDYAVVGGINPNITYNISGNSGFSIIQGYLFMTRDLPEGELTMQVVATDTTNDQSDTAQLSVKVESGLTTTRVPLSTTSSTATTTKGESTTNSKTTNNIGSTTKPSQTSQGSVPTTSTARPYTGSATTSGPPGTTGSMTTTSKGESTTKSKTDPGPTPTSGPPGTIGSTTTEGSDLTPPNPSSTSEGSNSTATTTHPHTVSIPSGGYGPEDMAALGATLGVLLFICLVVIAVLICHIQRRKEDWRKIYQTNVFRSSLGKGSGSQKEGIQYINKAFRNDEDRDNTSSGGPEGRSKMADGEPQKVAEGLPVYESIMKSSAPLHDLPPDNTSQAGSDKTDSEKEVKPILTKERRMEDGYKAVWFKEDIDPDAKEEVVIIPDSREHDSEEEDVEQPSSSREEDEDDNLRTKTPRVVFNEADLDSGIGVNREDSADDSEDDEVLTVNL